MRWVIRLTALVLLLTTSAFLVDRWQMRDRLRGLDPLDPLPHAQQLVADERWAEAEAYLSYFVEHNSTAVTPQTRELLSAIHTKRQSWTYRAKALLDGALTGTGGEVEEMIGAGIADLFVAGDIRDLLIQGNRWLHGEETDEVILALSSLGVAATAATITTAGGAGGIKGALSLLKSMRRKRLLPPWLLKALIRLPGASDVRKVSNALMEPIADLYHTTGFLGTREILARSTSLKGLENMRFFARRFGRDSAVLLRIDPAALRLAEHLPARTITRASLYGKPGFKALAKRVKYTARLSKYISRHWQGILRKIPVGLLVGVWLASAILLFAPQRIIRLS